MGKDVWADPVDWDKVLLEHRTRQKKEATDIINRFIKQKQKHRLFKNFLEQNDVKWNKRRVWSKSGQ